MSSLGSGEASGWVGEGSSGPPSVPQWKRELMMRRRAGLGRPLTTVPPAGPLTVACPSPRRTDLRRRRHTPPADPPAVLLRNMRLVDSAQVCSDLIVSDIQCNKNTPPLKMVEEKPVKKSNFKSFQKHKEDKQALTVGICPNGNEEDYQSDSSEELKYGPGIVNKLKTKYLSMTLRDNSKHSSRPSLSNLRRATSLENMLEDDNNRAQPKPHFIKKAFYPNHVKSNKISQHHAKYLSLSRGSDSMKRARSMDTLIRNDKSPTANPMSNSLYANFGLTNGVTPSIINEDIIIVDNTDKPLEEKQHKSNNQTELPPPDVVKQTLKIFETTTNKKVKSVGVQNKIKALTAKPVISTKPSITGPPNTSKPVLSPKPVISPEKRVFRPKVTPPKRIPVVTSTPPPKALKNLLSPTRKEPLWSPPPMPPISTEKPESFFQKSLKPSPDQHEPPPAPPQELPLPKPEPPMRKQKTPSPEKHETLPFKPPKPPSPDKPGPVTHKFISQQAIDNITKESSSVKFSFNSSPSNASPKSYLPKSNLAQATNTALITSQVQERPPIPPNPESPPKQVAVIRPVNSNSLQQGLTEQEIEKNHINKVKSVDLSKIIEDQTITDPKPASESNKSEKNSLWDKKPWQNQNSMVFNFSDRKSVPDYIENDGLILAVRKEKPVTNGCLEDAVDGEEEWDPKTRSFSFEGDNIVINGKSNLKKQPRHQKLKIQFNDEATTLFEYPSEDSAIEEPPTPTKSLPSGVGGSLSGSNLSTYTPSKTGSIDTFELGVTRTPPPSVPLHRPQLEEEADDYLKPLESDESSRWSEETAADMLF